MATAPYVPVRRPNPTISNRVGMSEVERLARKRQFIRKQRMEKLALLPIMVGTILLATTVKIIIVIASILGLAVGAFLNAAFKTPVAPKSQAVADDAHRVGGAK